MLLRLKGTKRNELGKVKTVLFQEPNALFILIGLEGVMRILISCYSYVTVFGS